MRISHSSSFFLATLAISSSTSSLAAPTEPGSLDTASFPSSSSMHALAVAGRGEAVSFDIGGPNRPIGNDHRTNAEAFPTAEMHMSHDRRGIDLLGIIRGLPLVGDILVPVLQQILDLLGINIKGGVAIDSVEGITQDKAAAIAALLAGAAKSLQNVPSVATGAIGGAAGAVGGVAGGSSAGSKRALETSDATTSTSAFYTSQLPQSTSTMDSSSSLGEMALPTPAGAPSLPVSPPVNNNGTAPQSPSLPVNPPNTPIAPPATPKPPVPAGVSPPSGPIPRDAPPMFPAFKAADVSDPSTSGMASASIVCPSSTTSTSASGEATSTPDFAGSGSSVIVSDSAAPSASATSA
ncbi:hypothetical protein C8Q77DRAFT_1152992 [Trametes polyzona]|nr:hypothetical protein C8Q77DRAFT_1152992 [Trametes polyzona]